MIIFSTELPNKDILEVYGKNVKVFNISSSKYYLPLLNLMFSNGNNELKISDDIYELNYDIMYHENLINNPYYFIPVFENIIMSSNMGNCVILLVSDLSSRNIESIIKFIHLRYGYTSYLCNSEDDFDYVIKNDCSYFKNVHNYDIDYIRYMKFLSTNILEKSHL